MMTNALVVLLSTVHCSTYCFFSLSELLCLLNRGVRAVDVSLPSCAAFISADGGLKEGPDCSSGVADNHEGTERTEAADRFKLVSIGGGEADRPYSGLAAPTPRPLGLPLPLPPPPPLPLPRRPTPPVARAVRCCSSSSPLLASGDELSADDDGLVRLLGLTLGDLPGCCCSLRDTSGEEGLLARLLRRPCSPY